MRWDDFRRSDNVEDDRERRRLRRRRRLRYPGRARRPRHRTVVVLGLIGWALGIDPSVLIGGAEILSGGGSQYSSLTGSRRRAHGTPADHTGQFVAAVLGNTEDVWSEIFRANGKQYRGRAAAPLPRRRSRAAAALRKRRWDRSIVRATSASISTPRSSASIEVRFHGCSGKACEFAEAYVIAQRSAITCRICSAFCRKAQSAQRAAGSKAAANRIQVRVELQADCLAGVWANHSDQRWKSIEPGDVEAALQTAAAIGDDRLQKQSRGYVVPDAFTHGTSAQRQRWFTKGLKEGKVSSCDTFAAAQL